jgi:GxxExxY protein
MNRCTEAIVAGAMRLHSSVGPSLLEGAYEAFLAYEVRKRGYRVATQVSMPAMYDGVRIPLGYRIDLLVENAVVVELKTVRKLLPVHHAQLLSYLKLGDFRLGLLINFAEEHLKHGIRRIVNGF